MTMDPAFTTPCIRKQGSGELWAETIVELVAEALWEDGLTRYRKFLLDFRGADFRENVAGLYALGRNLEACGLTYDHKVAVLFSSPTSHYELLETVMINSGFKGVRVFYSDREAHEWLK